MLKKRKHNMTPVSCFKNWFTQSFLFIKKKLVNQSLQQLTGVVINFLFFSIIAYWLFLSFRFLKWNITKLIFWGKVKLNLAGLTRQFVDCDFAYVAKSWFACSAIRSKHCTSLQCDKISFCSKCILLYFYCQL